MAVRGRMKRWTKDLFIFFARGAKLSATLQLIGVDRILTKDFYVQPGAKPVSHSREEIFNPDDIKCRWNFVTKGLLQLTNNSNHRAFDIRLLNAHKIFDEFDPVRVPLHLGPNEGMEMSIKFFQFVYAPRGAEPEATLDLIPPRKKRALLKILYQNKRGTKFLTRFVVSFSNKNEIR